MSRGVFLDRANEGDVPGLVALQASCHSHPWTASQMAEEVRGGPGAEVLVLRARGGSSRATIVAACSVRLVVDELEVLDVAVAPALRRRGLARFLLGVASARAARRGAIRLLLEARAGNAAALALYAALGFVPRGVRRAYYADPLEDAVLLELPLRGTASRSPGEEC